MAEDEGEKTEVSFLCLNEKGIHPFFYAKSAMATKVKSLKRFCVFILGDLNG